MYFKWRIKIRNLLNLKIKVMGTFIVRKEMWSDLWRIFNKNLKIHSFEYLQAELSWISEDAQKFLFN